MVRAFVLGLLVVGCAPARPVVAPIVVSVGAVARTPAATVGASAVETAGFDAHDEVEVEWNGRWWPAVVLERRGRRWLVHYENYGSDWDEVVGAGRIRERSAEPDTDRDEDVDAAEEPDP